ncbi:MAG TPA: hydroxymethylbilane synthase [Candidatus Mediterraneibacter vanvlietii]|nr:hydroxymethylbilane synthase [Candidatus Mediterraneibacter vanvlietii]
MQSVIRIGSRDSILAVRQAELIRDRISQEHPELDIRIITMKTTGDKILDKSLAAIGGKGLFVKELDRALLDGRIDIAVHSLKDVPMELNPDLPLLAFGKREDPRDVMIYRQGLSELPENAVIGTSSRRRELQLKKLCPAYTFRGIRGNVQTRMRKLEEEGYDGTLLAAAGLKRLGMEHVIGQYFSVDEIIPAAGQGILAVQGRRGEDYSWLACVDDPESRAAAAAERAFIRTVGGGCTSPSAAHAQVSGNEVKLTGLYYNEDSREYSVDSVISEIGRVQGAAENLARKLTENCM